MQTKGHNRYKALNFFCERLKSSLPLTNPACFTSQVVFASTSYSMVAVCYLIICMSSSVKGQNVYIKIRVKPLLTVNVIVFLRFPLTFLSDRHAASRPGEHKGGKRVDLLLLQQL